MKTVGQLLSLSTAFLQEKGVSQPRRQVEELLAHFLGLKRIDLYLQYDRPLEEKEISLLRDGIRRRAKGEPVEYIMGQVEFYGCRLQITPSVLIPRPETEILVDLICKRLEGIDLSGRTLWDLCSGSGCIGIALKKKFPQLTVILSDISPEAVQLALQNAQQNGVELSVRQGDLLAPFAGEKTDYITCNPPYIATSEYLALDPSVAHFEPKLALLGGERGTEYYEALALELPTYLREGGQVFFEIGSTQGPLLTKIFSPFSWARSTLHRDWSQLDRFFFLEKQSIAQVSYT